MLTRANETNLKMRESLMSVNYFFNSFCLIWEQSFSFPLNCGSIVWINYTLKTKWFSHFVVERLNLTSALDLSNALVAESLKSGLTSGEKKETKGVEAVREAH